MKCKFTGKEGYVEEEDCHCFCCGVHDGKSNNHKEVVNMTQEPEQRKEWDQYEGHLEAMENRDKYTLVTIDDQQMSLWSDTLLQTLKDLPPRQRIRVSYSTKGQYRNIQAVIVLTDEAGEETVAAPAVEYTCDHVMAKLKHIESLVKLLIDLEDRK